MHTVYLHIDEDLDEAGIEALKAELLRIPHVAHVEMSPKLPHDVLVEGEPHRNVAMRVLHKLGSRGLHSYVMSS